MDRGSALEVQPGALIPYTARNRLADPQPGDCVHFFLDDYRFETMWSQPVRSLSRVQRAGMALTPDFSLYPDMPRVVQQWNIYRSRWCGAWMAGHGIAVIPTVTWSDHASHAYAFLGLPRGATVAISTVGLIRASVQEKRLFMDGLEAMIAVTNTRRILVYGHRLPGMETLDTVDQVYYAPRRCS
jgi:hypothetical protein